MDSDWFRVKAYPQYELESGAIEFGVDHCQKKNWFCDFDFPKSWCVGKLVIAHRRPAPAAVKFGRGCCQGRAWYSNDKAWWGRGPCCRKEHWIVHAQHQCGALQFGSGSKKRGRRLPLYIPNFCQPTFPVIHTRFRNRCHRSSFQHHGRGKNPRNGCTRDGSHSRGTWHRNSRY